MTQAHHRTPSHSIGAEIGRNRRVGVGPAHLKTQDLSRLFGVRINFVAIGIQVPFSSLACDWAEEALPELWKGRCLP